MHHLAWCEVTEKLDQEDSAIKERPCVLCPTDQPPSKKPRKDNISTLPRDESVDVETSM